jgi:hypothetical protein
MTDESGDRNYPFHNPNEQKRVQELFVTKFKKNRDAAKKAEQTGEIGVFDGFIKETMDKLFVLEFQLTENTQKEIAERVTGPMRKIANDLGIGQNIIFAGDGDQDAHVTMHVGKFKNMSDEKQEQIMHWLTDKTDFTRHDGTKGVGHVSHLQAATEILSGLTFKMDAVFNSGRDTSISTASVDSNNQGTAYRTRKIFEKALDNAQEKFAEGEEEIGQHYSRYDDIFHTTVARFNKNIGGEKLTKFNRRVAETVGKSIAENPITIEVAKARTIIASEGVMERKPGLLKSAEEMKQIVEERNQQKPS